MLGTVPRSRRHHGQFAGTVVGRTSEIPRGNVLGQKCHEEEVGDMELTLRGKAGPWRAPVSVPLELGKFMLSTRPGIRYDPCIRKSKQLKTPAPSGVHPPTPALFPASHQHLEPFSCSPASVLTRVPGNTCQSLATSFRIKSKGGVSLFSSMVKAPPEPLSSSALALTHPRTLRVTLGSCATAAAEKRSSTERGRASAPSHAQLQHAQQFSILSAIFCSTELVVCIELVFIFPNMIYKHNHVSDFDIALGCKAGTHPGPCSAAGEHHGQGGAF